MKNSKYTTLQVTKKFYAFLDKNGKRGESYEDIIKRLIKGEKDDRRNKMV